MAMLAEPRRKQKVINLRAKNNAWSNDTNKFGQRMLEKMGWSSGKGLGAKENGIVEHVVARYKNDDRGLGFEDRNDQWTKHEDDFNALLSNLSNAGDNEDKLHSGISLEDKSKKSKARIHYHKYTRGKDLSRYSEKDLANIFGKKSLKSDKKEKERLNADIKTTEQVFMEGGSMDDYFKKKMASKTQVSPQNKENDNIESDFAFKGFSNDDNNEDGVQNIHSGFGFQSFSFYNTAENNITQQDNELKDNLTESITKKSKKKKKSKKQTHIQIESDSTMHEIEVKCSKKSKKSKKKKNEIIDQVEIDAVPRKKSKNKKVERYQEAEEAHENEDSEVHVPKKKKKKKNKV